MSDIAWKKTVENVDLRPPQVAVAWEELPRPPPQPTHTHTHTLHSFMIHCHVHGS